MVHVLGRAPIPPVGVVELSLPAAVVEVEVVDVAVAVTVTVVHEVAMAIVASGVPVVGDKLDIAVTADEAVVAVDGVGVVIAEETGVTSTNINGLIGAAEGLV